jgi:hypothetical protein
MHVETRPGRTRRNLGFAEHHLAVRAVTASEHLPREAVGLTGCGEVTREGHRLLLKRPTSLGDPLRIVPAPCVGVSLL